MESIDRLRRHVYDTLTRSAAYSINDMIDGIEREVKELVDERDLLKTQWEAGVDFDQRLEAAADKREDVTLFGVDYTALPEDADGVPIHVGDWITGDWDAKAKVVAITSEDVYWWEPDGCHWCHAYEVRHHHAPTVEDVLREFGAQVTNGQRIHGAIEIEQAVIECAAKLRLAGEDA